MACRVCGKLPPIGRKLYCSDKCKRQYHKEKALKKYHREKKLKCKICGADVPEGNKKYCSQKCADHYHNVIKKRYKVECLVCGVEFWTTNSSTRMHKDCAPKYISMKVGGTRLTHSGCPDWVDGELAMCCYALLPECMPEDEKKEWVAFGVENGMTDFNKARCHEINNQLYSSSIVGDIAVHR